MAVERDNETGSLTIKVENGTTTSGATAYQNKTLIPSGKMNPSLADADAYSIASALADMQTKTLDGIYKTVKAQLVSN